MLNVTDAAIEQLTEMLDQADVDAAQGIRLIEDQGEVGLRVDAPQEGDQVVSTGERPVLLIEPRLSAALDGATLDATDMPEGKQLTLVSDDAGSNDATSRNGTP